MDLPRYLDTKQAAQRLVLGESTLEKMRMNGEGPDFIRATSRRVVYAVKDLDAFMEGRRTSANRTAAA